MRVEIAVRPQRDLISASYSQVAAGGNDAAIALEVSAQYLDEGGLAATVATENGKSIAGADAERQVREQ